MILKIMLGPPSLSQSSYVSSSFWFILIYLHYELLENPHYSPDLAPSDFCLFPKLKIFLAGQRFSSNQEVIAAVVRYFADLTKNHYRDGIMSLEYRWNKCISLKGDYVEK
jgi:hypothetical protein